MSLDHSTKNYRFEFIFSILLKSLLKSYYRNITSVCRLSLYNEIMNPKYDLSEKKLYENYFTFIRFY